MDTRRQQRRQRQRAHGKPKRAGSYTYVATGSNVCHTATDSVTIVVLDNIQVDAQPDTTVILCAPEEVCFTADAGGLPIIWLGSAGDTLGFGAQLCVTPPVGTSQYTATAEGQCVLPDVVNVEVAPDTFDIDITASADTICLGDSLTLTADLIPDSISASIEWTLDGNSVGSGSEITVSPSAPGSYTYVATGSNVCHTASDSVTIVVLDNIQVDAQPDTTVILCAPEEVCFTADAGGLPVIWLGSAGDTLGFGAQLCVTPPAGTSQYTATAEGQCVLPDVVNVEVAPDTFDIDITASADTICLGDSLTLTAGLIPDSISASIEWTLNGNSVGSGSEITVSPSAPGSYTYVATGSNGCHTAADSVTVVVLGNIQVEAQPDTALCLGETAVLSASVMPAGGATGIEWTLDGDMVGGGSTLLVSLDAPGTYIYVATATGPCNTASDSVMVEVSGPIQLSVQPDTSICVGDSATLTAQTIPNSADATIVWTLDGDAVGNTGELVVSQDTAGTYTYVVTAIGLCNEVSDSVTVTVIDSLQIDAQPDSTILLCAPVQEEVCLSATADGLESEIVWVDAIGNALDTGAELCVLPPIGESLYIATLPDHNCAVADTVRVLVDTIPPPPPIFADSTKICLGDTAVVDVDEDYSYPFVWIDENGLVIAENEDLAVVPDTTGTFEYIIQASNGCGSVQDTAVVTVLDSSAVEIIGGNMPLCLSDTAILTAEWTIPECVVWTDTEGEPIDTGAQIIILPFAGTDTIIAQVPGLDCVESDTVTVTFLPPPSVDITLVNDAICQGDTAVLTAEVLPPSSTNFVSWYDADFNFITDGDTLAVSPVAGTYTYIAIAENACGMDTAFAELLVEQLDLELIVTNDTICPDEFATLEVVGCEDCTYNWTPEEGLSDPESALTDANPDETTLYTVEVMGQACVEELSATITVIDCPDCMERVFVADALTPNKDGKNESVCLRSKFLEDYEEVKFMIYDRWGEELFHSTDIKNMCWDGTYRGKSLPPDVYGYFLRVKCPGRDAIELKGNITLLK